MTYLKCLLALIVISMTCFAKVQAQQTDRFIRIIGNAERYFKYEKLTILVTITELAPNEYRQSRYKSVEQIKEEYLAELSKLGISSASLVRESNLDLNGQYQKVKGEKYRLTLNDDALLIKLGDVLVEGVATREVKYMFKNPDNGLEDELSMEAIKDAKRKAEKLAKEIGKKVGKVLNIEDKSSGCCKEIRESTVPSTKLVYRLNITFELID